MYDTVGCNNRQLNRTGFRTLHDCVGVSSGEVAAWIGLLGCFWPFSFEWSGIHFPRAHILKVFVPTQFRRVFASAVSRSNRLTRMYIMRHTHFVYCKKYWRTEFCRIGTRHRIDSAPYVRYRHLNRTEKVCSATACNE